MRGTLKAVPVESLSEAWVTIRDDISKLAPADGWIPEDIYFCLRNNGATLFMIYDADLEYAGFTVLRLLPEFDGPRLHLWILYAKDAGFDVMTEFEDDLMTMARAAKAQRITFSTPRAGWEKVAPRHGFRLREVVYERPVKYPVARVDGPLQ